MKKETMRISAVHFDLQIGRDAGNGASAQIAYHRGCLRIGSTHLLLAYQIHLPQRFGMKGAWGGGARRGEVFYHT